MSTRAEADIPVVGIDVGGTFTDFAVVRDGVLQAHKVLSTPDDPARAVLQGLHDLGFSFPSSSSYSSAPSPSPSPPPSRFGKGAGGLGPPPFTVAYDFEDLVRESEDDPAAGELAT